MCEPLAVRPRALRLICGTHFGEVPRFVPGTVLRLNVDQLGADPANNSRALASIRGSLDTARSGPWPHGQRLTNAVGWINRRWRSAVYRYWL